MKLIDLLPYLNENANVSIVEDGNEIEKYNGKDSISEKYDDMEVCEGGIRWGIGTILVEVKKL